MNVFILENYLLKNPEEKYDPIPEIMDGHNVLDYIDLDINEKLAELEREEEERERNGFYELDDPMAKRTILTPAQRRLAKRIRDKKNLLVLESREKRTQHRPELSRKDKPMKLTKMRKELGDLGIDIEGVEGEKSSHLNRSRSKGTNAEQRRSRLAKRAASLAARGDESMEVDGQKRSLSLIAKERSKSRVPRDQSGMRDVPMIQKARKLKSLRQRSILSGKKSGRAGEADRHIWTERPRHLFAGKRGSGTANRR